MQKNLEVANDQLGPCSLRMPMAVPLPPTSRLWRRNCPWMG